MEFTIFDARSFGITAGQRWHVIETNRKEEPREFSSLKKARAWLADRGFTFRPKTCTWS